jgi:hypothetical protein
MVLGSHTTEYVELLTHLSHEEEPAARSDFCALEINMNGFVESWTDSLFSRSQTEGSKQYARYSDTGFERDCQSIS